MLANHVLRYGAGEIGKRAPKGAVSGSATSEAVK